MIFSCTTTPDRTAATTRWQKRCAWNSRLFRTFRTILIWHLQISGSSQSWRRYWHVNIFQQTLMFGVLFAIGSTLNRMYFYRQNEEINSAFGEMWCTKWGLCEKIIMYISTCIYVLHFKTGSIILPFIIFMETCMVYSYMQILIEINEGG